MNTYLTEFLEMLKENKLKKFSSMGYKYGQHGRLKKTKDQKIQGYSYEEANYEKIIQNMSEDYQKYKKRLKQVQDHNYILNLKSQIDQSKHMIAEIQTSNSDFKSKQFLNEKKMNCVIGRGCNDAMEEIQSRLKMLTTLSEKKKKLDEKIEFQNKTESEIDSQINNMEMKSDDLERKAASYALSIRDLNNNDEYDSLLYDPKRKDLMKKKAENHSINALQRIFFTKIYKQREKVEEMLLNHNSSIDEYNRSLIESGKESESSQKIIRININEHPLMIELNQTLNKLKVSLPKITSKLPWDKPKLYQNKRLHHLNRIQEQSKSRTEAPMHKISKSEDIKAVTSHEYDDKHYPEKKINAIKQKEKIIEKEKESIIEKPREPVTENKPKKIIEKDPKPLAEKELHSLNKPNDNGSMFMTEPLETKTLLKGSQNNNHDNEEIIGKQEGLYESKKQNVKPDFKRRQINNEEQTRNINEQENVDNKNEIKRDRHKNEIDLNDRMIYNE